MKTRILFAALVLVLMGGSLVFGQTPVPVKIEFPFSAGAKEFPAGQYTFEVRDDGGGAVIIMNGASGAKDMLAITRLGRHDRDGQFEAVFDKLGGKYFLSEVWFPDKDGYLVLSTKEAHEHAVVGGSNPRK